MPKKVFKSSLIVIATADYTAAHTLYNIQLLYIHYTAAALPEKWACQLHCRCRASTAMRRKKERKKKKTKKIKNKNFRTASTMCYHL